MFFDKIMKLICKKWIPKQKHMTQMFYQIVQSSKDLLSMVMPQDRTQIHPQKPKSLNIGRKNILLIIQNFEKLDYDVGRSRDLDKDNTIGNNIENH